MDIKERIKTILAEHKIVLFMKGSPEEPRCGFSARAVTVLKNLNVSFHSVDVLYDEEMRQGIKDYGNWPTIPQLYFNNNLIGGSDIVYEMYQKGELKELLLPS